MMSNADPFDLDRFVAAQAHDYEQALAEVRAGRKRSHWMWYIFPQVEGLGSSGMARKYAIQSLAEAEAFLAHPLLGPRLIAIAEAALACDGPSATAIFGTPDDQKLRSCATLFDAAGQGESVFTRLIDRYFQGERDERTIAILNESGQPGWG